MHVFAVQPDIVWEEKGTNFSRITNLLKSVAVANDSLIVLPEMFSTGFSMNLGVTCQKDEREDEAFLQALARNHHSFVIGGVVSSGTPGKGRNEAVLFSPDGALLARYAKMHPFTLGGEADGHNAGSEIVVSRCAAFDLAPFICYDLRFPEVFRAAAARGANLFVVMALWPVKRQRHWLTLLQARAIENQAYVVGVNRVGVEPNYSYAGRSVVVDPHGIIIADAGEREGVLTARLDLEIVRAWRSDFPALCDAHWNDPPTRSSTS
jgi:omega-amidase